MKECVIWHSGEEGEEFTCCKTTKKENTLSFKIRRVGGGKLMPFVRAFTGHGLQLLMLNLDQVRDANEKGLV